MTRAAEQQGLSFSGAAHAGFRLHALEVLNWGTFDRKVWTLAPGGENALLTGDIGSGKSTLVDALVTLLVPPQKVAYNRAAGAEARERTLKSYVLGHYKSGRSELGASARPVALRDATSYSVLLGRFSDASRAQHVTLAQVFWMQEADAQPARLYVVDDKPLSIAEHFSGFGPEISGLRKRLKALTKEVHDTFPPYAAAFRRRFGIDSDQALELFHQTVSMKSVGNLTEFVRQHMLQPFPVEERIEALLAHFDDLTRAHEAVLQAKDKVARLTPIVADAGRHEALSKEVAELKACRQALRAFYADKRAALLHARIAEIEKRQAELRQRKGVVEETARAQSAERDRLKQAIAANGGEALERIRAELADRSRERDGRHARAKDYDQFAKDAGLEPSSDTAAFARNLHAVTRGLEECRRALVDHQNDLTDASVRLREVRAEHDEVAAELDSLRKRRSNIPSQMLTLRERLCSALGLAEDALPFAGELLRVRDDERQWEGAIERVLRAFGVSLLVSGELYPKVAQWVDRTHLGDRLVYYRVREDVPRPASTGPSSLVRKLEVKPDAENHSWLQHELARRFDLACCTSLDELRREQDALSLSGQVKRRGDVHEKDDRHRLDDRGRYVLGWSNAEKISALEQRVGDMKKRVQIAGDELAKLMKAGERLRDRERALNRLAVFQRFADVDWRSLALQIVELEKRRDELEKSSDKLRSLQRQLAALEKELTRTLAELDEVKANETRLESDLNRGVQQMATCERLVAEAPGELKAAFPALDRLTAGGRTLTLEDADERERSLRDDLDHREDERSREQQKLAHGLIRAMQEFRAAYPAETREMDASIAAAPEYTRLLQTLVSDDLPRFERRFKELLNENTIREVANFQSQLQAERRQITERVEIINKSLRAIDYSPGRYIELEARATPDPEVKDFQGELRACVEGTLTGSDDDAYSERKFEQVRRIIERFRGREGTSDADARWRRKVTDVRNWFVFSASERYRETNEEHEHYTDSGGKSGGQKEKLAYTVLAASLAYQFGLEQGARRTRSFRFVMIDEAFGRGSDESAAFGLELFRRLELQLLVVTPLQKIHVIEPFVASVGFVHNDGGERSMIRNLTVEEYRAEKAARAAGS